jgi:glycosyltransferase involved in cell wall biosynthesis
MYYPKISIVIPSYNQGKYLEETILSVINQNYPNLEYVIIDDGSTDNSVEIIKKYEKYLTYWVSEKDNGQSDAINKGLKKCTGEIFNWLNSDDYLETNALFKIAEAYKKIPKKRFFVLECIILWMGKKRYLKNKTIRKMNYNVIVTL